MRRLYLLSSLCFLLAVDTGRAAALAKANHLLETGRWRMAISAYEAIVDAYPTSARARLGLAVALGEVARCDRSLALLSELRGRRVWSASSALAEGRCHLMLGDRSAAFAAFEEAHLMDVTPATTVNVAVARAEENRTEALQEALDELALYDDDVLDVYLRADLALRAGGSELDGLLADADRRFDGELPPGLAVVEARRWMDLDHPTEAASVLLASLRRQMSHVQSAIWRAEALRRAGQLADADSALSRPIIRHANQVPLGRSVRARMAVDGGDLDTALAMADALPLDEEGLATRWYVARARGEVDDMSRLAARWAEMCSAGDRSLGQLVPLHLRATR